MTTSCPTPAELLAAAIEPDDEAWRKSLRVHLHSCASCRRELEELREDVGALRASPPTGRPAPGAHLDDRAIACLVDGAAPEPSRAAWVAHLAACPRCRAELVAATGLIADPSVAAEIAALEASPARQEPRRSRISRVALAGGLAAAGLAGLLLLPPLLDGPSSPEGREPGALRERTITTTAAPRILGPVEDASADDSLRWTSVPRADLYRLTVWDRQGTVAWQGETRDTALRLPVELVGAAEARFLWEVEARTGFDRWVTSELAELTVRPSDTGDR